MDAPTDDELNQAFRAGFLSIDEALGFYPGFDGFLSSMGYTFRQDAPCICADQGEHGHLPECHWVRDSSTAID